MPFSPSTSAEIAQRYIYTLELENNKFYVGQSKFIIKRLKKHFWGEGAVWTKLHKPIKVTNCVSAGVISYQAGMRLENEHTIELMKIHDWKNVRGGNFTNICEVLTRKNLIANGHHDFFSPCELPARNTDRKACKPYYFFILGLENDKYFLGYTSDPERRIKKHFNGKGSQWTITNKPVVTIKCELIGETNESTAAITAANETILLMRERGWQNVRGGPWIADDNEAIKLLLLARGYVDLI
jgi:predicted GIY-YIG superfamily endonuclease